MVILKLRGNLLNLVSVQNCDGLKFYPTCKPASQPVAVSQMLAENRRLLTETERSVIHSSSRQHDIMISVIPGVPQVPWGDAGEIFWECWTCSEFGSQTRSPRLGN